jgi:RHS repeat-associated protein
MVTDSGGNVLAQLGHFPYGESWYNANGDKLQFTTYERDAESGNDYAQARSYVNRLARFSSLDPLAGDVSDPQSLNRYSYVRNMPIMLVDPTGECPATLKNIQDDFIEGHGSFALARFHEADADADADADPDPQGRGQLAPGGCGWNGGGGGGGGGLTVLGDGGNDITGITGLYGTADSGTAYLTGPAAALAPNWLRPIGAIYVSNGEGGWNYYRTVYALDLGALGGLSDGSDPDGGVGSGSYMGRALVALLNKKCAALFGGAANAFQALFSSTYNNYTPGQANPYPSLLSSGQWSSVVGRLEGGAYGVTPWSTARPGGITFFAATGSSSFYNLTPGFGEGSIVGQMTAFMHELEHGANHSNALDLAIDSNYAADAQKINTNCSGSPVETIPVPVSNTLTPP